MLPNCHHGGASNDLRELGLEAPIESSNLSGPGIECDIARGQVGADLRTSRMANGVEQPTSVQTIPAEHHAADKSYPPHETQSALLAA
jgi:hypothetical protein